MIRYEEHGEVATIAFDNGRLNILTRESHRQLFHCLLRFLRSESIKVAVLTSVAGTSFSAGDDLKEVDKPFGDQPDWSELVLSLPRTKPVVGAVEGHCLGQGLVYLMLLADIRYAASNAQFGFPEIRHGYAGASTVCNLQGTVPTTIAMHMALTGEPLSGAQAASCFLVNEALPVEQLRERAMDVATRIARHPMEALKSEMSPLLRQQGPAAALEHFSRLWELAARKSKADGP